MNTESSEAQTPEGFEALVRELLKLPPRGADAQLWAALAAHGELTPEWYRNRIDAIEDQRKTNAGH